MKIKIIYLIIMLMIIEIACVKKPGLNKRTNPLDPNSIGYTPPPAPKGWVVTTFAGKPGQSGFKNGIGTNARFNNPGKIIASPDNTKLYVTENHRIRKIDIATATVSNFSGSSNAGGPGIITGSATAPNFNQPWGMVITGGYLYVCDCNNNNIKRVDLSTGYVDNSWYNGSLAGTSGCHNDTTGTLFYYPYDITFDGTLYFYITDQQNSEIRQVNTFGVSYFYCGATNGGPSAAGDADGTGLNALFNYPDGIVYNSSSGCFYVADYENFSIRQINVSTKYVLTIAGQGIGNPGSTDGGRSVSRFQFPVGITLSYDGNYLWITDNGNFTIRRLNLSTTNVETIAGLAGFNGNKDGTGSTARFWFPAGIVDVNGIIYVVDSGNQTIRKIEYK